MTSKKHKKQDLNLSLYTHTGIYIIYMPVYVYIRDTYTRNAYINIKHMLTFPKGISGVQSVVFSSSRGVGDGVGELESLASPSEAFSLSSALSVGVVVELEVLDEDDEWLIADSPMWLPL